MRLEVDIRHRLGAFDLAARFGVDDGLVALFGRSGAGKTSLINVIAGLVRPQQGRVVVDGVTLLDTERAIFVPGHKRRVGYVFQDGRLFPHLSVRQNLLYGRWFAPKPERRDDLGKVAELLGLERLLDRAPANLSGGEKQRVAIGRALLASPRLLLMDEPLASLDEARKAEILPYIERLRDESGVPIVYVSHSMAEVARLASTIVLMADGTVAAVGPVADVLPRLDLFPLTGRAEASALIEATVESHDAAFGLTLLRSRAGLWRLPRLDLAPGVRVRLRIFARDVMLAIKPPEGISALNIVAGVVADVGEGEGAAVDVRLDCSGEALLAAVTRYSLEQLGLKPGAPVFALVKSVAFDRRSLGGPLRPSGDETPADA